MHKIDTSVAISGKLTAAEAIKILVSEDHPEISLWNSKAKNGVSIIHFSFGTSVEAPVMSFLKLAKADKTVSIGISTVKDLVNPPLLPFPIAAVVTQLHGRSALHSPAVDISQFNRLLVKVEIACYEMTKLCKPAEIEVTWCREILKIAGNLLSKKISGASLPARPKENIS